MTENSDPGAIKLFQPETHFTMYRLSRNLTELKSKVIGNCNYMIRCGGSAMADEKQRIIA
jgi:hypothetical protein